MIKYLGEGGRDGKERKGKERMNIKTKRKCERKQKISGVGRANGHERIMS